MAAEAWCSVCRIHTVSDIDRCSVCGTRRALPTGPECSCAQQMRTGQVFRVRNTRCPSHGDVRPGRGRLRSV